MKEKRPERRGARMARRRGGRIPGVFDRRAPRRRSREKRAGRAPGHGSHATQPGGMHRRSGASDASL